MTKGRIRIGTSGWHYRHWVGPFYPEGTPSGRFLEVYASRFGSVEINGTFYRLPSAETVGHWRETAPPGFVFACKASRFITHMKKLKDPAVSTRAFFDAMGGLGEALGPILFQLPPRWHVDVARLDAFLEALPGGRRYAFEFRDETWLVPEVYAVLERYGAALCIYDYAGRQSPVMSSADFVYVRLHGPGEAYRGRYDRDALTRWAGRIGAWRDEGIDVYCYFDNDEAGFAALDAECLARTVEPGGGR